MNEIHAWLPASLSCLTPWPFFGELSGSSLFLPASPYGQWTVADF